MDHSFNIEVAKDTGIAGAVILNNLYWWVDKNAKNGRNFNDGKYWTYNKKSAFLEQFPYLTERQIEYALTKLRDSGYIEVGNYNKSKYDRTLWYTLTEKAYKILDPCNYHGTNLGNGTTEIVEPIPDINTNIKSLSKDKEEQAPPTKKSASKSTKKKSYKDAYSLIENVSIRDSLVRYVNKLKEAGRDPKVSDVEKWAKALLELSGEDPKQAEAIVQQSIDREYYGIYPLKKSYNSYLVKKEAVSIPVSAEDKARNPDGSYVKF